MGLNPDILETNNYFPILTSGAFTMDRVIVGTTAGSANEHRGAQAAAVGQNADLALVPRFLGIATEDKATGLMTSIQRHGRRRATGGGVITAPALVTFDADGKLVSYAHDATKFGMVVGFAATSCGGDGQKFDLVIMPMLLGPASAASDNFTLSATLQAADVIATDDLTVGDDAAITGLLTVGETLGVTGVATFGARVLGKQGADVASANDLVLGSDGNCFEITGATQINHIANTGWQNGSVVTLLFTSTPTVDHANATSGANITILLAGAVDFVAAAGDRLVLQLCEIGGAVAWREIGRTLAS